MSKTHSRLVRILLLLANRVHGVLLSCHCFSTPTLTYVSKSYGIVRMISKSTNECCQCPALPTRVSCQAWSCFTFPCACASLRRFFLLGLSKTQQGPSWRSISQSGDAHSVTEMCLQELPIGVYVKLDNCSPEFLPALVCEQHRLAGFLLP